VRGSGTHLLGLIDQVLEYAHVESGTMRFAAAPVPLASLIAETNAIIQPLMSAAGITYSHTAPGSIIAQADAHQVRQILLNLLTNATKFTPKGGHVVLVCEANDGVVYIRVADSGVGIPSDKLEAIFQPFVQADSALTRVKGGVGLGLAISRDLARAMHGELSVSSVEGTGSVFTLTLPRADAAA
jgi:signal transduction histidine kinase